VVYLGIDLGGTNIAVGVVNEAGRILHKGETPTLPSRPWQAVAEDMARLCLRVLGEAGFALDDLAAIGMGVPGIAVEGVIPFCTNLGWHEVPMAAAFRQWIDKPLYIDNDANVAGYAEAVSGVSASAHSSVFLTLGTGVGGSIILNGKPYSGFHGVGGELGHLTLVADGEMCTCGKRGCLERYCSATALIRMGVEAHIGRDPARVTAKLVIDAAKAGNPVAQAVFDKYIHYLALGINTIVSFIDPEIIVLGGGVSHAGAFLLDAVRAALPKYIFFKTLPFARLELATLGNDAGIIGAAMLGRQ
jgi:glucokinase